MERSLTLRVWAAAWLTFQAGAWLAGAAPGQTPGDRPIAASSPLPNLLNTAETRAGTWRFTTEQPAAAWRQPDFNDQGWSQGRAGFGTEGTPNATIGTEWKTPDIWLRRSFDVPAGNREPQVLRWHHDEDAEVYLNGELAAKASGFLQDYENREILAPALATLKPGRNTIAIHCHQTTGGQYIDVGLVSAADSEILKYGDQNQANGLAEGNPLIPGLFADPSAAKFGDTYYIYSTTDGFGWPTGRWVVWKSRDFVHWSFQGESFPEITGQQNWAPGVPVYRDHRYWLPYTLHGREGRIAVADQPEGPFHDAFANPIVNDIDSELFIDDDGTPYVVWGRPMPSINRLKPDFSAVVPPPTRVDFHQGYVEGPFLFKRKGVYYLCGANLGYAEYRINYSMGDSPIGPFRFPADNFIVKPDPADNLWGTGHGNVLCVNDRDEWVVIYLRSRMGEKVDPFMEGGNVYRQVCADRFSFNADGTIQRHGPTRKGVGRLGPSTERGVNLALGKRATASSALRRYGPEKAVDGGFGTRWITGDAQALETWWQVDLGKVSRVERTEISFNYPTELTPYTLRWSTDGITWQLYADHTNDSIHESPKVDRQAVKARFLRVVFTNAVANKIPSGLWEFKAFDER